MTSEKTFRDHLKKEFYKQVPEGDFTRIENIYISGVPDINICVNGIETWIEAKWITEAPTVRVGLRDSQKIWIRKRVLAGGRVVVAIANKSIQMFFIMNLENLALLSMEFIQLDDLIDACNVVRTRPDVVDFKTLLDLLNS